MLLSKKKEGFYAPVPGLATYQKVPGRYAATFVRDSSNLSKAMYALLAICCFLGFFQQYNTSARARFAVAGNYERLLRSNPAKARWTGLLLMLFSLVEVIMADGWMPEQFCLAFEKIITKRTGIVCFQEHR